MKLIVGLGNPGMQYEETRHNIGFKAIDAMCSKMGVSLNNQKFNGLFYKDKDVILAKPLTYMNLSGDFVQAIAKYFDIKLEDILVIYDDMDFEVGSVVMKPSGSGGGQNGIKDIILKMGTDKINRMKIGIGRPHPGQPKPDYVLGRFTKEQVDELNKIREKIVKGIELFINKNMESAMLSVNSKPLIHKLPLVNVLNDEAINNTNINSDISQIKDGKNKGINRAQIQDRQRESMVASKIAHSQREPMRSSNASHLAHRNKSSGVAKIAAKSTSIKTKDKKLVKVSQKRTWD